MSRMQWAAGAAALALTALASAPAWAEPDPKLVAADALFQSGKFKEAEAAVEGILKAAEASKDPIRIADASAELAAIRVGLGDMNHVEPLLLRVIELRTKALGPKHPDTVRAKGEYGTWLTFQGRDREAEPILAAAADALEAQAQTAEARADAAEARASHAMVLFNLGRWSQGETEMKAALAVLGDPAGPRRPTEMAFLTNLGDAYLRWGRYQDALAATEKALKLREERQGPNHPDVAGTLSNLGLIHLTLGDEGKAEADYKRALQICEAAFPDGGTLLATAVEDLGQFYSNTGRTDQAIPLLERAVSIREKAGDHTWRMASTWRLLALARLNAGDGEGAAAAAEKALALYQSNLGPDTLEVGTAQLTLARIRYALGDNVNGELYAKAGLATYRKALSPDNPRIGDALYLVGFGAQRRRDRDAAEDLYGQALKAMIGRRADNHEAVINTRTSLAQQILIGKKDPRRAFETVQPAADALREKALANARVLGREGAPNLSGSDRNVFFISVRTAWAFSESLKAETAPAPAKP